MRGPQHSGPGQPNQQPVLQLPQLPQQSVPQSLKPMPRPLPQRLAVLQKAQAEEGENSNRWGMTTIHTAQSSMLSRPPAEPLQKLKDERQRFGPARPAGIAKAAHRVRTPPPPPGPRQQAYPATGPGPPHQPSQLRHLDPQLEIHEQLLPLLQQA